MKEICRFLGRVAVWLENLEKLSAAKKKAEELRELFGEDFYSDVLDYKDSKDEELSFMDELESSLF